MRTRLLPLTLCCALPLAAQTPEPMPAETAEPPAAETVQPAPAPEQSAEGPVAESPVAEAATDAPADGMAQVEVSMAPDGTPVIKVPAGLPAPLREMLRQRVKQELSARAAAVGQTIKEPVVETIGEAPAAEEIAPVAAAEEAAPEPEIAPQEQPAAPLAADLSEAYKGIVKIEVAVHMPDFQKPWQSGKFGMGNGTGFMVSPGVFLTNAHVVANAERIYISPFADSRKIPAMVRHVAHDADLALVEIADKEAFAGVPCLQLSNELPQLEDSVRAIGYPIGGKRLSVTRGIVSRIDTISYAHPRNADHLALQIDAAINPGNSGGPVLKDDKVIGVAFQGLLEANSTGYVIPAPVIAHFLKDVEDGRYDGYVELGATFMEAENPALRRHYNLPADARGCLVADVVAGGSCDGLLQPGDIVLEVAGHAVDSSAMIELDGVRVNLQELAERSFKGDVMHFVLQRAGRVHEVDVKLAPLPAAGLMALSYDELPAYVHFGGLVFQPLNINVISAHRIPSRNFVVQMDEFARKGGFREKDDIVMLTEVLPDELNARANVPKGSPVTKVNGTEVKGLAHLYSLLYPEEGQERPAFTVIELAGAARPIVFDNAAVDAANGRISARYSIPAPARLKPAPAAQPAAE